MIAPPSSQEVEDVARARAYESAHNRMFVVRVMLTVLAVAFYLFSGASVQLAEGLRERFGEWWAAVNALYLAITLFGFAVFMFPTSLYADYTLEHRFGLSRQDFSAWLSDFGKALALELVLGVLFFSAIYALLAAVPAWWWIHGTLFYVVFSTLLTTIAPVLIIPLFHDLTPLEDSQLAGDISDFMRKSGLPVLGVFKWGLEETTATTNAALTGLGRTRRIILGDNMIDHYSREEILAILAHEVGHHKNRDILRMLCASTLLAGLGFYLAHVMLGYLTTRLGYPSPADIASFPLFVFCLFVFSLVTMPLLNAFSRHREFAADAYAVRTVGQAGPLISALNKLAGQNLADREPPFWMEVLLHSHPSVNRRIHHARLVEESLRP